MESFLYFVRHAESIYIEGNEKSRGLSAAGQLDAIVVRDILLNEKLDGFISSPYERAIETIRPTANMYLKEIQLEEGLRERNIGQFEPLTFEQAKRRVYEDVHFSYPFGESSLEAQIRAVKVIEALLETFSGKRIVIGTHGDIMTLILNYFDAQYGFDFWKSTTVPDIYKLRFQGKKLISTTRLWRSEG